MIQVYPKKVDSSSILVPKNASNSAIRLFIINAMRGALIRNPQPRQADLCGLAWTRPNEKETH
jgi:hypothetical protein